MIGDKSITRALILVLSASSLLILGTYVSGTVLTPYAQSLNASWLEIGILSGSMYTIRLIFGTSIGKWADRKGAFTALKVSMMLYPLIAAAYYFSSTMPQLIFARLIHGVASAMMIPMGMAYVGGISPAGKEGRYISIYNLCTITASGVGTVISTRIAAAYGYQAAFFTLFLLAAGALLCICIVKPEKNEGRPKKREATSGQMHFLWNRRMIGLVAGNLLLALVSCLMGFFVLPYMQGQGIELKDTGSIVALFYLVTGFAQIPLLRVIDKYKIQTLVISGIALILSLLVLYWTASVPMVIVCIFILGLGVAGLQTSVGAYSVIEGRRYGMGKTMGFLNTANSAGMILGSIAFGILPVEENSYGIIFLFAGVFSVLLAGINIYGITKGENEYEKREC